MSTETYEYEKINAKDKPVAEDFVYVYSEIEDGGFRKVSKEMLKMLLGVAVKISELENDSGFVTKIVSDLENYYLKSETYSKQEIDNKVSAIPKFGVKVVSSLPVTSISETTIYLVSNGDDSDNLYTEYINVNGLWEILGTQKIASVENAVLYTVQILTDEQKTQARTNIGAIGSEDIPKSLPASDVYSWAKQPEKPSYTASEVGALPDTAKIPTNTSDLTNNSGYITKTVNDLANYYLKSQTYSAEEIDNKISSIPKFSIEPVEQLPTSNISTTTVYLLKSGEETDNLYTEYIRVNGKWEYLGKQTVDLSGYVKKTELSDYYTETEIDSLLETIRNSIPTKLSQMTADETHRTVTDAEKQTWNNKSNFSGNYDDLTNKPSIPSLTGYAKESYVQEYAQPKGDYATNEKVSQLENAIGDYLPKNQGSANVGKILVVGTDGNLVLIDMPSGTSGDVTGVIDENNNILLNGELADGTYTLKYENEDGTYTEIGNLVVGAITPSYTNLANPSDANWKENTRINSSYSEVTADGVTTTNYIEVSSGDVICIENMNLVGTDYSYSRIIIYNNETPVSAINPTVYPELFSVDDNGVTSITAGGTAWSNAFTHFRICGYPTGDSEDVIITINEEIV